MSEHLTTVRLYLEAVRDADADTLRAVVAPDVRQCSPELDDGLDALLAFVADPPAGVPIADGAAELEVVEGDLVATVHAVFRPESVGVGEYPFFLFQLFRVRNGLIIERHSNLAAVVTPGVRSAPLRVAPGDPAVADTEEKRLVLEFYRQVFDAQDAGAVARFVAEAYDQRLAFMPPGRDGLVGMLGSLFPGGPIAAPSEPGTPHEFLLQDGGHVVIAGWMDQATPDGGVVSLLSCDAYHVADGRLRAHWAGVDKAALPQR